MNATRVPCPRPVPALPALLALALALGSCAPTPERADRIILMIADGAGVTHWSLAVLSDSTLAIRDFPVGGLVDTRGSDVEVTGSAPGATAYSTGRRSFMGAIGVAGDSVPVETVLEIAAAMGKSTGLITTSEVVDATPASFAAHERSRDELEAIADQMSNAGLTVLMGGGRHAFDPAQREDGADLIGRLRGTHTYVETGTDFAALDIDTVSALVGLFADGGMGMVAHRSPALTDMVEAGLDVLDQDADGFFLLIENEETDTQAHDNAPADILTAEILDFDRAVRLALDYQRAHPSTLLVVTADHETGGGSLPADSLRAAELHYATGGHTAALVPLFAIGPGAEAFGGLHENRQIGQLLREAIR